MLHSSRFVKHTEIKHYGSISASLSNAARKSCSGSRVRRVQLVRANKLQESIKLIENMKQTLQNESGESDHQSAMAYLKTIGFTNTAELARILDIAMNPNSLFVRYHNSKRSVNNSARQLDVEKDIKPVIQFLESKNLSTSDIIKVISGHPPILSYNLEQRLAPFWDYLSTLGIDNVNEVILSRPSVLGLDVDQNLKKIVGYLQYVGTEPEKIVEYLRTTL